MTKVADQQVLVTEKGHSPSICNGLVQTRQMRQRVVPEVVPPGLRTNAQRMEVAVSPAGGTIWQWVGEADDVQRVVLLNDSTGPRAVTLSANGDCEVMKLTGDGHKTVTVGAPEPLTTTLLEEERPAGGERRPWRRGFLCCTNRYRRSGNWLR